MLKKKVKNLQEYYYQWMCKHKDDADRRLGLLRRYEKVANECPECGAKRGLRTVHVDDELEKGVSEISHAPNCEMDAECNG